MSSSPRTLADLKAVDDPPFSCKGFYGSLRELRRSALSIPNRLGSILEDAEFVRDVASAYRLPLIANERCGSWYISPDVKAGSSYFKSTDGHTGQWDFSLRRLNLQVLDIVGKHGGCIIVDSTRRGKVMPDAFSKTVPIWCAVMNRVLFPEHGQFHQFQLPGDIDLPGSEIAQITSRLDHFTRAFEALGIDQEALRRRLGRPMRLQGVIGHCVDALPAQKGEIERGTSSSHQVILCSASRRVKGAEMSEEGYIQGAGDDSESWSQGMTPSVFWTHRDVILGAQESELPGLIRTLLLEKGQLRTNQSPVLIEPTNSLYIGRSTGHKKLLDFGFVINCHNRDSDPNDDLKQLNLRCGLGKLGSRDLRKKLHDVESSVAKILETDPSCRILITCESGKDLSIGVALMLLCRFYSFDGRCSYKRHDDDTLATSRMTSTQSFIQQGEKVDKGFISQRLAWVISSKADVNPSRSTLQSVNAYLMDRP